MTVYLRIARWFIFVAFATTTSIICTATLFSRNQGQPPLGGSGLVITMFVQLLDSLFKENLAPPALVTILGGSLSYYVVEAEVAKISAVQTSWKWVIVPRGANAFLVSFPFVEILQHVTTFEYNVKSHDVKIAFSEWNVEEVPRYFPCSLFGCTSLDFHHLYAISLVCARWDQVFVPLRMLTWFACVDTILCGSMWLFITWIF